MGMNCVLIFLRAPQLGRVKTRLARFLDQEVVLALYKGFVADLLETLRTTGYTTRIYFYPADAADAVRHWLGDTYLFIPQRGEDLGARMANAFTDAFGCGIDRALLVGSDLPDLPASFFDQGFAALEREGTVIGPAIDGGYYMVGFQRAAWLPEVFDDMPWGGSDVLRRTLACFEARQRAVHLLPRWRDLDEYRDLESLIEKCQSMPQIAPHTRACLRAYGMLAAAADEATLSGDAQRPGIDQRRLPS